MISSLTEEITRVAYDLYEKSNRKEGNDLLNWLAAEKIVNFRNTLFPASGGDAIPLLEYKPLSGERPVRRAAGRVKSRSRRA